MSTSQRPLVLYHGPACRDGWTAAWVAKCAMPNAECIPVQYGQEPPNVDGRQVYILDFSYPREVLLRLAQRADGILVLDHHKTAAADLAGGYVFDAADGCRLLARGLLVRFDMTKSGARLAWEHFHPGKPAPWLVRLVEDRDLWAWKLPDSRAINAYLETLPLTFDAWSQVNEVQPDSGEWRQMIAAGETLLRYQEQIAAQHVMRAQPMKIAGHTVACVNATTLFSEVAGKLAEAVETARFAACYFRRNDGKWQFSLRSRAGGMDVSAIAQQFGGGGHEHAAGFEVDDLPPLTLAERKERRQMYGLFA